MIHCFRGIISNNEDIFFLKTWPDACSHKRQIKQYKEENKIKVRMVSVFWQVIEKVLLALFVRSVGFFTVASGYCSKI